MLSIYLSHVSTTSFKHGVHPGTPNKIRRLKRVYAQEIQEHSQDSEEEGDS
jgi:hypothetical protein